MTKQWHMKTRYDSAAWLLLVLGIAATACGESPAAEYFVAKGGSDSADGRSKRTALATIGRGLALVKPGDFLTILPGQCFESASAMPTLASAMAFFSVSS